MKSSSYDPVAANAPYAESFEPGDMTAPPVRRLAVLTCMDARVVPHPQLGLNLGDAHVIRNAGGRATEDAVRSLMVSTRLLGVGQVLVVHHTDCGNLGTDEEVADKLRDAGVADPPLPLHANDGQLDSIAADVRRLRASELLAEGTSVEGYLYDVTSGRVARVEVS